jgi:hypothetical protein
LQSGGGTSPTRSLLYAPASISVQTPHHRVPSIYLRQFGYRGCFNTLVFFTTLEPGRVEGVSDDGDVKMRDINEVQPIGCLFAEVELDLSTDYWHG